MEVRRAVIAEVHPHHNPEESSDLRHSCFQSYPVRIRHIRLRPGVPGPFGSVVGRPATAAYAGLSDNEIVTQAITRDPETMHGVPVFRGTRVPVQTLFDYLEGGDTLESFLEGFPTVSRATALEALEEAKGLLLKSA